VLLGRSWDIRGFARMWNHDLSAREPAGNSAEA
jgi:hypothetical protein